MAENFPQVENQSLFSGGIADYNKSARANEYAFGRALDYRTDPNELTLLPATAKESGSTVLGLILDGDAVDVDDTITVYAYDNAGRIYTRSTAGSWAHVRTVADSTGNGMKYFGEDDYLYYTSDTTIGRYGKIIGGEIPGVPTEYADDFLGAQGGVPLNTHSLDLESGSSQYAWVADNAATSITGDLAIELYIKPESLPSVGNSMTLVSKWDDNGNIRSYKFDIYAVSGYFGDGSDGALTISSNTTEAPIDSAATGTSGAFSLTATNASFAANQEILIHQSRGTGAGTKMRNKIVSYVAGTITLERALNATYTSGAQVRVLKQYTNVTVNSGITYTAKAWSGSVGGIIGWLASGTVTATGTITANGAGYEGGTNVSIFVIGEQGEGTTGAASNSTSANGSGGGGGDRANGGNAAGGGAGGGHAATGTAGSASSTGESGGSSGGTSGSSDLTTITFGGGGGSGGTWNGATADAGGSGYGGGIVYIIGVTVTVSGGITSNGATASNALNDRNGGGGGGAGGSILIQCQTATLGTTLVTATGGSGGTGYGGGGNGGAGSVGRIHVDYYTSVSGTTSPTLDSAQDNTLVTTTSYQLRLGLSSNGTAEEFLTKTIDELTTAAWQHVGVSWDASDAQAEFFYGGASKGTSTGAVTSLNDNASRFAVGADFNNTARNFLDGKVDDVRVWNTERTAAQVFQFKDTEISSTSAGLAFYTQCDNNVDDETAAGNDLATAGGATFDATDVPFASPTTRLDIDQSTATSGQTYTTPTSVSETSANKKEFVPAKDPQTSIGIEFGTKGTGAVTVVVHDAQNRIVHSKTVSNDNLPASGDYEFQFDTPWTPVIGATYHFHIYSTVNDATVVTGTNADLSTVDFKTYYQFLKDDPYHPMEQMLNLLTIGNARYLATWDAVTYNPHRLTLPPGWRVRCLAKWREYLAIGCWKGTDMTDFDQGIIFFWDGTSDTYNDYRIIPEGGINAMYSTGGTLYISAGYQGDILEYTGGDRAKKIKKIPKMTRQTYIETYPHAMTMWQSLLRIGVAGPSNNSSVERGVYTYGSSFDDRQPESFSYDYPISTGNRANTNIEIGWVFPIANKLLISWKDNVSYGCDVVNPAGNPASSGTIEKSRTDKGAYWKEKQAQLIRCDFEPLASGESIRLKYKIDRASDWTFADSGSEGYAATAADTKARMQIPKGRYHEIEFAADIAQTGGTAPTILELSLVPDRLLDETTV